MPSFTAGYGPQCVMSDNGAGKVRVTFPAWDFDWELYDDMTVDGSHYLYNQTTATSAAITAKGGSESAGYYFDLGGVSYPDGNWNDDDRVVPTFQAAANDYSTVDLAFAAMAHTDIMVVWYSDITKSIYWYVGNVVTTPISLYGGLSRQRILLVTNGTANIFSWVGDLSSYSTQVTLRNHSYTGQWTSAYVNYVPTLGNSGAGLKLKRALGYAIGYQHIFVGQYTDFGVIEAENCIFIGGNWHIWCQSSAVGGHKFRFLTMFNGGVGGVYRGYVDNVFTNIASLFMPAGRCFYQLYAGTLITYCASTDATADDRGGAGNIIDQIRDDLDLWDDNDNNSFYANPRILTTSSLYHTGIPVTGIPRDIDGNLRDATNPSIGAHEGTLIAYPCDMPIDFESRVGTTKIISGVR